MAHHTQTRPSAILNKKMTNFSGKIKEGDIGEKSHNGCHKEQTKTVGVTSKRETLRHFSEKKKCFVVKLMKGDREEV